MLYISQVQMVINSEIFSVLLWGYLICFVKSGDSHFKLFWLKLKLAPLLLESKVKLEPWKNTLNTYMQVLEDMVKQISFAFCLLKQKKLGCCYLHPWLVFQMPLICNKSVNKDPLQQSGSSPVERLVSWNQECKLLYQNMKIKCHELSPPSSTI
jgi:hypothetical protein